MSHVAPISDRRSTRERLIVALDVATRAEATEVIRQIGGAVGAFKIGMQLFTAAGPEFVRELADSGLRIFLDLKFHDIPNTVARAGVEAARLGVWMFNVHAGGGRDMMLRTVETVDDFCSASAAAKPRIIAVTVLTSSTDQTLSETGVSRPVGDQVALLASLASESGLDGVVASAREVPLIRKAVHKQGFITVTPGIRGAAATPDDQRRVTTIGDALVNGSSYAVIGRPILEADDRVKAVEMIIEEAERALQRFRT